MKRDYLALSDFSLETYWRKNSDLRSFKDEELVSHYLHYGIDEGRLYNFITNRESFLQHVVQSGNLLEIGPLDRPQINAGSPHYHSLDVFTKSELQELYKDDILVDKSKILEPTYVIVNNDYSVIKEKFGCIFSSHNIEHVPCVVTFLLNLQSLLTDEGNLYFIVPDKRYCFDYYKKETDIYDVLQLYYEKNYRPRLGEVLKMRTLNAHNDPKNHWRQMHGENPYMERLVEQYSNILSEYQSGKYLDSHVSFFTPHSFLDIMELLRELGLINLEIKKLYHTIMGSNEFYVVMGKVQMSEAK